MTIFPIPKMCNKMVSNSELKNLCLSTITKHVRVVKYITVGHSLVWLSTEILRINFLKNLV